MEAHSVSILCDHAVGANRLEIWFVILDKIEPLPRTGCIEHRVGRRPTCGDDRVSVPHPVAKIANRAHEPVVFSRNVFEVLMVGAVNVVKKYSIVVSGLIKVLDDPRESRMASGSRP